MKLRYTLLPFIIVFSLYSLYAQEFKLDWVNGFAETYSPSFIEQVGCGIQTTVNGDIIVAGTMVDSVDLDPSSAVNLAVGYGNEHYGFFARYTSSGALVWQKTMFSKDNLSLTITSLVVDKEDNIFISGYFFQCADLDPSPDSAIICRKYGGGKLCPFVAKYDGSGNYLWAFSARDASNTSGMYHSLSYDISLDETNNAVYFISQFRDSVHVSNDSYFSNGGYDIVLVKLDSDGNYLWSKQIGGPGDEYVGEIKNDSEGNIVFTGHYEETVDFDPSPSTFNLSCPAPGISNIFFSKFNANGQFTLAKSLSSGDDQKWGDVFYYSRWLHTALAIDENDNIYIGARFDGTIDLDPGPGNENITSEGPFDFFIARYTALGTYFWKKRIFSSTNASSSIYPRITSMVVQNNSLYVTGNAGDSIDFDVETVNGFYENMNRSGFISNYSLEGAYRWNLIFKSVKNNRSLDRGNARAICFKDNDYMYVTGEFGGITDFDNDGDTSTNTLSGTADMFIAKFSNVFIGIDDLENTALNFSIYPNPASEQVFISLSDGRNQQLEISDAVGRIIERQIIRKPNFILDVSTYPKGLYFVKVSDGEKTGVRKLVVK